MRWATTAAAVAAALGGAAAAAVGGWSWAAAATVGALAVGLASLLIRRARRTRQHEPAAERDHWHTRRTDGPWSAYDRRRSAPGERLSSARGARRAVNEPTND